MQVATIVTGPLEVNCYIVIDTESSAAAVIDPGDDAPAILALIAERKLAVQHILLTHAHFDHIGAVAAVQRATGAPVALHRAERANLERATMQSAIFGFPPPEAFAVSAWLEGGELLTCGALQLQVLLTPGHSPGGCCFYGSGQLFAGDVLFHQSIGRSDLPGGDGEQLLTSIRSLLFPLPDETVVYPGHGATTTIGYEKKYNPFLR
ncbi:MAG TPA: MBL fold metallo-hydrolase [bacterium]|nr:MBL fold metallo-hydrolase [bacterium]HPR88197.1 MBL fold metallo-hydrolase [bacterium]